MGLGAQDLAHKGSAPPSAPVDLAEAPEGMPLLRPSPVFPEFPDSTAWGQSPMGKPGKVWETGMNGGCGQGFRLGPVVKPSRLP